MAVGEDYEGVPCARCSNRINPHEERFVIGFSKPMTRMEWIYLVGQGAPAWIVWAAVAKNCVASLGRLVWDGHQSPVSASRNAAAKASLKPSRFSSILACMAASLPRISSA